MNETFKKTVAGVTLGGLVSALPFAPIALCEQDDICGLTLPELWHTEQQEPAPSQTTFEPIVAYTGSTTSHSIYATYGIYSPLNRSPR